MEIWRHSDLASHLNETSVVSFSKRWLWIARKVKVEELRTIAALLWEASMCRNKNYFDHENLDALSIAMGPVRLVENYRS